MRVSNRISIKALATVTALLFSACVTPPQVQGDSGDRNASYERPPQDRYDDRGYDNSKFDDRDYGPSDPRFYEQSGYEDSGYYSRGPSARIGVLIGGRQLESLDFDPTDELGVFGVDFAQVKPPTRKPPDSSSTVFSSTSSAMISARSAAASLTRSSVSTCP